MSRLLTIFISFISSFPIIRFSRLPTPTTNQFISNLNTTATTPHSSPGNLVLSTQFDNSVLLVMNSFGLKSENLQLPPNPVASKSNWKRIGKIVRTVGIGSFGVLIIVLVLVQPSSIAPSTQLTSCKTNETPVENEDVHTLV